MGWSEDSKRLRDLVNLQRECGYYGDLVLQDYCDYALEIINRAYREGYITRKVRDIAVARTYKVMNGDWMLEHPVVGDGRHFIR
jgi:hypothetical protein